MSTSLALYQVEDDLQALLDTEELVPVEQQEEFKLHFAEQLQTTVNKRQACGEFLLFCQRQQEACDKEIARIQKLRDTYATAQERCEGYVVYTIERRGPDEKGKYPKLAGRTLTLSVCRNPDRLDVQDEALIPDEFRSVCVKLPYEIWSEVLSAFDGDDERVMDVGEILSEADGKATVTIDKVAIRDAIKAGQTVPGADLLIGGLRCKVS